MSLQSRPLHLSRCLQNRHSVCSDLSILGPRCLASIASTFGPVMRLEDVEAHRQYRSSEGLGRDCPGRHAGQIGAAQQTARGLKTDQSQTRQLLCDDAGARPRRYRGACANIPNPRHDTAPFRALQISVSVRWLSRRSRWLARGVLTWTDARDRRGFQGWPARHRDLVARRDQEESARCQARGVLVHIESRCSDCLVVTVEVSYSTDLLLFATTILRINQSIRCAGVYASR